MYLPKLHKQPKEVVAYTLELLKPVKNRYLALGAVQIVVAMGMTYFEQRCYFNTVLPIINGQTVVSKDGLNRVPSSTSY